MKKVAMIGVGKLGQDCAEVMGQYYDVVGYDVVPRSPAFPMKKSIEEAVKDRDFIFIAAPTPHDPIYGGETPTSHLPNKDFDYTIVTDILKEVNKHVNKSQLVVLISTVLPGTVRSTLEPCITNARFIYNPYLIAMGTVKWDMVNPEMVIIGTEDGSLTGDASELIDFYKVFMENNPRYEVGTWDEAEAIKIFYNTFISTKLALVNMIQDVAETNGNMNVDVVTQALAKSTHRIMGPAYMKAALGDAGACHPRDNIALRYLAERLDLGYDLFDSIMTAREVQAERMALRCLKNGKKVTIIGKAYKPCVPYTNGSASMLVGYYIEKHGGTVRYYDLHTGDTDHDSKWSDVYLIGYWDEYVETFFSHGTNQSAVVIDPWRKVTNTMHTGEIIHYGDTRKYSRYAPITPYDSLAEQVCTIWPEIRNRLNEVHLIDTMVTRESTFVLRPTEDIIQDMLDAQRKGKTKFMFHCMTEAFIESIISKIQRITTLLVGKIDSSDIFYLVGTSDAREVYENLASKRGWTDRINILPSYYFQYATREYANRITTKDTYEVRVKDKPFLCFNKLNREHRVQLLEKMLEADLVDKAYYSFEGHGNWIADLSSDLYPNIIKNKDKFPLRLNITSERHNPCDLREDDIPYHENSYFSVVTETVFYDDSQGHRMHQMGCLNSLFLSEKTYRCFVFMHPFVLFARPHLLKEIHRQGFKTFSPWFDESYDNIEDDGLRFEKVTNEIIRLANLSENEWLIIQGGIKEILEYNRKHFYESAALSPVTDLSNYFTTTKVVEPIVELPPPTKIDSVVIQPIPQNLNWDTGTMQLNSSITLEFPRHIESDGHLYTAKLIDIIRKTGKHYYERALDWCCGNGVLGFEVLGMGIAKQVVFADSYHVAVDTSLENASKNHLGKYVTGHVAHSIKSLPDIERWDLVVCNPPQYGSKQQYLDSKKNKNMDPTSFENTYRLYVDEDWGLHKEFFSNINEKLLPGADVFMIDTVWEDSFIDWARANKLLFRGKHPIDGVPSGSILHFKAIG